MRDQSLLLGLASCGAGVGLVRQDCARVPARAVHTRREKETERRRSQLSPPPPLSQNHSLSHTASPTPPPSPPPASGPG